MATTSRDRETKNKDGQKNSKIDPDICRAQTLPVNYYREQKFFELAKDRIFTSSWQFAMSTDQLPSNGSLSPWTMLEGYLDEPLLFTQDEAGKAHCLSNVCTHRGSILAEAPGASQSIRCRYHGRRFSLAGQYLSAPGFEDACDFPAAGDNLPSVAMQQWGKLAFVSINPVFSFDELVSDMTRRLHWLPFDRMRLLPEQCKDYVVNANWILYVENYLEGLHVPFVHPGLATVIDTKDYRYEIHEHSNLQIGIATKPEDAFSLPADSPEAGDEIAAYYYWLFPNTMLNFYPWGLSLNVVLPLALEQSCIRYITYVYDESKLANYSPQLIEKTEYEDEAIIQLVQKGMQSRLYKRGRYSPHWEKNVHHFHSLLTSLLSD
jgi:choline monooxygenase